ncbi:hypothetical protein BJ170DRAFT_588687, partial [Xylariales sp. AK1849]
VASQDPEAHKDVFLRFLDTWEAMKAYALALFRDFVLDQDPKSGGIGIKELIRRGEVAYEPLAYEDFLPMSAAGSCRSNLGIATSGNRNPEAKCTGELVTSPSKVP